MCEDYMDACNEPCFEEQALSARKRIERLDELNDRVMRDCARTPSIANRLDTLNGMAQETCIHKMYVAHLVAA